MVGFSWRIQDTEVYFADYEGFECVASEVYIRKVEGCAESSRENRSVQEPIRAKPARYINLLIYHLGYMEANTQQSVKAIIEQMCNKENKYVRQYEKEDFLARNDFIFDLRKTHKLKLDRNSAKLQNQDSDLFL